MISYRLTVGGRTYSVEIESLDTLPIVVLVDGERYEVSREGGASASAAPAAPDTAPAVAPAPAPVAAQSSAPRSSAAGARTMKAPMPGTVLSVRVRPGDKVEYGDEIGVLEAMKMKSSLRTERAGTIAEVRVAAGQSVAHGDVLVTFE